MSFPEVMRILRWVSIALLSGCAHTPLIGDPSICNIGEDSVVATHVPNIRPKYFFKPVGDDSKIGTLQIAFVGTDPADGADRNYLYHPRTGALMPIPGALDPIGLFATSLISVPLEDEKGNLHIAFYDLRTLSSPGLEINRLLPLDRGA